jgi:hypothetical protein
MFAHLFGDSTTVQEFRRQLAVGELDSDLSPFSDGFWEVVPFGSISGKDYLLAMDALFAAERSPENGRYAPNLQIGRVDAAGRQLLGAAAEGGAFAAMLLLERSIAYPGLDQAASEAAGLLAGILEDLPSEADQTLSDPLFPCMIALHRALEGDTAGLVAQVRRLDPEFRSRGQVGICPAMVEAFVEGHRPPVRECPALDRLEELARLGLAHERPSGPSMLLVARLARTRGDLDRALDAVTDAGVRNSAFFNHYRPPYLKEEGELAELTGHAAQAIRAFRLYLNLVVDPDAGPIQAQVDSVRDALATLEMAASGSEPPLESPPGHQGSVFQPGSVQSRKTARVGALRRGSQLNPLTSST